MGLGYHLLLLHLGSSAESTFRDVLFEDELEWEQYYGRKDMRSCGSQNMIFLKKNH